MTNLNKTKINKKVLKFDYNFNVFYLMQLVARNYFKNYGAIFTDYVLPIIIMTILFSVLDKEYIRVMLPGIIIAPLMSSGFISFAMGFFQWKNSIIFKKIKISQISTFQFFLSFFIFYFLASVLSFIFTLSFAVILKLIGVKSLEYFFTDLKLMNWGIGISAVFLLITMAISLGILMAFLVTNFNSIIAIGLTIFLVSAFLLGCYLSLQMVVNNEYMYKVSWFIPFYSPIRIFQIAWLENAEYSITTHRKIPILVDENNQTIFLEKLNLNVDLDDVDIKRKINDWLYKQHSIGKNQLALYLEKELKQVTEGWKVVWKNSWNLKLMKDFKILSLESWNPNFIQYDFAHFHKSYWSAFLLGFSWIITLGGIISLLNFYKKK